MFEFFYTQNQQPKKALEELRNKISKLDFEPNLAIFFLTERLSNSYEIFKADCNSISVPVEGIITPEGVWSRGALVLLTDSDVKINLFEGNTTEVCKKLEKMKKGNFNLLIYPLIFVKSRLSMLKTVLRLQRANVERASKIFEEIIYPMNSILRPFRSSETNALSMNIFPLKIGIGIPKIALNGKKIDRAIICISFKEKFDCKFADTFPERGKSAEETAEILMQELPNPKKVSIVKRGIAVKEIDGLSVKEFIRKHGIFMRIDLEKDFTNGNFFGATPYGFFPISKETYGSSALGLMDYDLKFYPSLFDLDLFFDEAIFAGEFVRGGMKRVMENIQDSDFALIDQNFMLMFEERIVEIAKKLKSYGVLICNPTYTGKLDKRFMSEIERGICVNGTETMVFLNFK